MTADEYSDGAGWNKGGDKRFNKGASSRHLLICQTLDGGESGALAASQGNLLCWEEKKNMF